MGASGWREGNQALLVVHDVDPPKRHDLDLLCRLLPIEELSSFAGLNLPELSRWALEGRYPDDFDDATRSQAAQALELARTIFVVVERRLSELMGPDREGP